MAQNDSYPGDPILRYRPPFVQSLPVQIFVTGITLTLTLVLILQLVFTAQYHWPLARTNYILQVTGAITLFISITATIYVIFSSAVQESQHWPYMLSYIAVKMPGTAFDPNPSDPTLAYQHKWTVTEGATWVVMNATTSVVVQITHIHFLTLLFPSNLEARLIFGLLGPLAVTSAVMQLLPIFCTTSVKDLSQDTRNVCNAALSLLFTSLLLIWGCFVNRRQAWRTDGGTAAFGAGAIIFAFISTSLNFLYIPQQDHYSWMPKLMWAITLWQSFFGWWWWVGAGMGVREVEELLHRENKRQQKRLARAQRRKEQRERARSVWKGVTGAFKPSSSTGARLDGSPESGGSSSHDASSVSTGSFLGPLAFLYPVQVVQRWCARLWHAHLTAAHIQAAERAERMHQVFQREEERNADRGERRHVVGWGLGSYSMREAERERREEIELQEQAAGKEDDEDEWKDVASVQVSFSSGELRHRTREREEEPVGSSLWWWGPLRRWRLKDSTTYR